MAKNRAVQIIYTGGTFGMRATEKGYVPAKELGTLLEKRVPELGETIMPVFDLVEYAEPLESSNAGPADWLKLAQHIRGSAERFDGFVVIHGTDTLAYTASALSFLLADLDMPIILTGAQIPLVEVRSDAQTNLINALCVIADGQIREVCVCFGRHVLRGNRTTKIKATELDAFASPNHPSLAEIGTELAFPHGDDLPAVPPVFDPAKVRDLNNTVAVVRIYPGIGRALIDSIASTEPTGLVLQCYGVGTAPTGDPTFTDALLSLVDSGTACIAVSECREGRVTLNRYAAGSALADAGVLSGHDMTTEAALTKLHVLLAADLDPDAVQALMETNLRGELRL